MMTLDQLTPEVLHTESVRVQENISSVVADELPILALTGTGLAFIDQVRIMLDGLDGDGREAALASLLDWLGEFRDALTQDQPTEPST
jgi:hypothetical protein